MTFKMDGSGETQGVKDNLKELTGEASSAKVDDNANDVSRFARERNLLLLSALYKLYGEEWNSTPDWTKVTEEIHNAKIPVFGENFTPESCELQYKLLLEKGYQVGIADITTVLKAPKRLTEAQTRMWILASTSNDIVGTSKIMDEKIRAIYKKELTEIDKLPEHSDISTQEVAKELEVSDDMEVDEDAGEIEEYEDPEAQEVAAELPQYEVNEKIVGMKDVLLLVKYCHDAVENAVKKFTSLKSTKQQPSVSQESSPVKVEKIVDVAKSNISTNQVSQELSNLVHSAIAKASEDDAPKITSPTSTAPTLSKLLELPITAPGMPLPEIPCVKPPESSPEKQTTKYASRGNSKERTLSESVKQDSASVIESSPTGNGEQTSLPISSPVKSSPVPDTNGQVTEKSPSKKSDLTKEKPGVDDSTVNHKPTTEKTTGADATSKTSSGDASKSVPSGDTDVGATDESKANTAPESVSEVNDTTDTARLESPSKGKQAGKKSVSAARPVSTRTSSRLVSPEPNDQPTNEEEKSPKKTLGRQTSTTESHTPILRSRRGATPTKAGAVESEPVKSAPVSTSKLDFTEENDDETFETPRSTPESPEMKSDNESSHDTKPPKQLKVYSAKPPSPLSHVDPTIFDEFIDDEDDPELAMIDSNVHKSKSDKTAPKPFSRRGRTASSENASDAGTTEDTTQSKRVAKKVGSNEDADEAEGAGNNDEAASKRLTRSSLKLHDAANDEGPEAPQTESEKAASESSFSGKEKKPRASKTQLRLKNLQEEISRVYGEGEETPEGKRVTRARAKTTVPAPEKRSKPPSVGDSEGLSESEPNPTRATRSRSSTASSMPVLEPTTSQQPPVVTDDEEQKTFRKNALILVEKIMNGETFSSIQKHLPEDPHEVLKQILDIASIKARIESGKIRTIAALQSDLLHLGLNVFMAHPNSSQVKEHFVSYYKLVKSSMEEGKCNLHRNASLQKNDNSDVESLESHDEQRSETSKQTSGGGRRKRKRSVSETSEEVLLPDSKRRVTRTSTSNAFQLSPTKPKPKTKHPISPDIVSANRVRH